eukprot:3808642-Pyramimonas_sp.AAC.1
MFAARKDSKILSMEGPCKGTVHDPVNTVNGFSEMLAHNRTAKFPFGRPMLMSTMTASPPLSRTKSRPQLLVIPQ